MKIRSGFVSNSSSASFFLTVRVPVYGFATIFTKLFPEFSKETFKVELKNRIIEVKKSISKITTNTRDWEVHWITSNKKQLKGYKALLKSLENLELDKYVIEYFKFHNYFIQQDTLGNTTLNGYTTMYNSDEDMGELFLEVVKRLKKNKTPHKVEVYHES